MRSYQTKDGAIVEMWVLKYKKTHPYLGPTSLYQLITHDGCPVNSWPKFIHYYYKHSKRKPVKITKNRKATWMHGPHKLALREELVKWVTRRLNEKIKSGSVITLPCTELEATKKYFARFLHVSDLSHHYAFENNKKQAQRILKDFDPKKHQDTTLILSDVFSAGLITVPDGSVTVFDLDLMKNIDEDICYEIIKLVSTKANPKGFYLFLNTSYGRSITKLETEILHRQLQAAISRIFMKKGFLVARRDDTYFDTSPMFATSICVYNPEISERKP